MHIQTYFGRLCVVLCGGEDAVGEVGGFMGGAYIVDAEDVRSVENGSSVSGGGR